MSERPFIVASEKALKAIPAWLAGFSCNTCSHDGGGKINVGRSHGRRYTFVASIIVRDPALFDKTLETVKSSVFAPIMRTEP